MARIDIFFDENDTIKRIESEKPSSYLVRLYDTAHGFTTLDLIELTDEDLSRILYGEQKTVEDEENALLIRYFDSLRVYCKVYTQKTRIPVRFKEIMWSDSIKYIESNSDKRFYDAVQRAGPSRTIAAWLRNNPTKDKPVKVDKELKERIDNVFEKARSLAQFYNNRTDLSDMYANEYSSEFHYPLDGFVYEDLNDIKKRPFIIFYSFYDLFAPTAINYRELYPLKWGAEAELKYLFGVIPEFCKGKELGKILVRKSIGDHEIKTGQLYVVYSTDRVSVSRFVKKDDHQFKLGNPIVIKPSEIKTWTMTTFHQDSLIKILPITSRELKEISTELNIPGNFIKKLSEPLSVR